MEYQGMTGKSLGTDFSHFKCPSTIN